jgi:fructose-1,6-bisphosphatase/inositol monophosphatase family enzyme
MQLDLKFIHQKVSNLMPAVNRRLIKQFSLPKKIAYKAGGVDHLGTSVVTETDKQVEKILKTKLLKILPGSGFIGEESEVQPKEYNWIVDPIDGTLNFANQVPVFACSIGLWHENRPVYACVSLPLSGEVIHAINDQGIWLNGRRVRLIMRNPPKLFLTYSLVGDKGLHQKVLDKVLNFSTSPRTYGSCVFHGAQIALGRIDAGVFINQALWDIAAIVLLAREAGLAVKYLSKTPNISKDDLKNYQYSLVIAPEKLAVDLCRSLS